MVNERNAEISGSPFQGYRVKVDLDNCDNLEDIVTNVTNNLKNTLDINNFIELLDEYNYRTKLHIHSNTFVEILNKEPTETIWVCSHC